MREKNTYNNRNRWFSFLSSGQPFFKLSFSSIMSFTEASVFSIFHKLHPFFSFSSWFVKTPQGGTHDFLLYFALRAHTHTYKHSYTWMDTWDKSKTEAHKPAPPSIVCSVSSHMFNFRSPIGQHSHDPDPVQQGLLGFRVPSGQL